MSEESKKEIRAIWDSYENGLITQGECFQKLALVLAREGLIN